MAKRTTTKIDPDIIKASRWPSWWISEHCKILDSEARGWIGFSLYPFQLKTIETIHACKQVIICKSRQSGFTWIAACYALWSAIFEPINTILVFSKDEEAASKFLGRIKGTWERLPEKFKLSAGLKAGLRENQHIWEFSNGSTINSFTSSGKSGRGDTGTLAIIDEAEYIENFPELFVSVRPTIAAGGKMIIMSTVNGDTPESGFKGLFGSSLVGNNEFVPIFSPWTDVPKRTEQWFQKEANMYISMLGSHDAGMDKMRKEFPRNIREAFSPNSVNKRLHQSWIDKCFIGLDPMKELPKGIPSIPELKIYHLPVTDPNQDPVFYCIGCDPAGGGPAANDSAFTVLRCDTGEEVAVVCGKLEPTIFAGYIDQVGRYYNNAQIMIENAFHGQHVIPWLRDHSPLTILKGHDRKYGWTSSMKGKVILYDICADAFRNGEVLIHTLKTITQLENIEGNTGKAPEPLLDDLADSVALALAGIIASLGRGFTTDTTPDVSIYMKVPKEITESEYKFIGEDEDVSSYSQLVENMVF